jgi:hypothetical protein
MTHRHLIALAACGTLLAGCGAGGAHTLPATSATTSPQQTQPTASVRFTITVPQPSGAPYRSIRPSANARRKPSYVSPGTATVNVFLLPGGTAQPVALGGAAVSSTSAAQTVSVPAPLGSDRFEVDLDDASGKLLATAETTATVSASGPNDVAITELGVPAYVTMAPSTTTPALGSVQTIPLNVTVYDADGYPISGAFPYGVAIGVQGPTNDYVLSKTTLNNASDASGVTLAYDGTIATPARVWVSGGSTQFGAALAFRPGAIPTGTAALVVDQGGNVSRIDARTYAIASIGNALAGGGGTQATALAASPDGREALIGLSGGGIAYYDGATKTIATTLTSGEPSVVQIAFSNSASTAYVLTTASPSGYAVVPVQLGGSVAATIVQTALPLPAGATNCTGIAPITLGISDIAVAVACSNATYDVPLGGGATTSVQPGIDGPLVARHLGQTLFGQGTNGTTDTGLVGFDGSSGTLGTPVTYAGAAGRAMALDPTGQTLYASTASGVSAYNVAGTGGTPLMSVPLPSSPVAIADYPGLFGGTQPVFADASVWAAYGSTVAVVLTSNATVGKQISTSSTLVGLDFVP